MYRLGLPLETVSDDPVPEKVIGYISVRGPESLFGSKVKRLRKTVKAYYAKKTDRDSVRRDLEKSGFTVIAESALGLSVSAPGAAYEEITGGKLRTREVLLNIDADYNMYITHIDIVGDRQPKALGVGRAKSP